MSKLISLLFFFMLFNVVNAEEIIDAVYLKDSTVVRGYILEQIPDKSITIRDLNDKIRSIEYKNILRITKLRYQPKTFYDRDYPEFGFSAGFPIGLNLNFVHWFSPMGIGISGMYWGTYVGAQINLKFKLSDNKKRSHSLSLLIGSFDYDSEGDFTNLFDSRYTYYGVSYNLNYKGFWLEAGLGALYYKDYYFNNSRYTTTSFYALPIFQIGYVYRFID